MSKPGISFIGLGAMGFGMATHLVKQSYPVRGFDNWAPTLERFRAVGGSIATSPAAAVRDLQHCVCMVATAQQAQAVLFEGEEPAVKALPQGATLLLCSTVSAAYAQALAKQITAEGREDVHLIDCPVSGGAGRAADGTLSIMAGGSDAALDKARFLLQELSDPTKLYIVRDAQHKSGGIGAGSNMKMCHQVLAANQILAASEAMGFAKRLGLDLKAIGEQVLKSDAWSWMFENRLPRILHSEHLPIASALTIILKDTSIVTGEGRLLRFPTPMCSIAEQMYFLALQRGYGADDDSGVIRLYTEGADKVGNVPETDLNEQDKSKLVISLLKSIHLCSAAEALQFGARVGLDLDQLRELCNAAAGGSTMFERESAGMINHIKENRASQGRAVSEVTVSLEDVIQKTQKAVNEAQRLKFPLPLGSQALNLLTMAKRAMPALADAAAGSVVVNWSSGET